MKRGHNCSRLRENERWTLKMMRRASWVKMIAGVKTERQTLRRQNGRKLAISTDLKWNSRKMKQCKLSTKFRSEHSYASCVLNYSILLNI